jgi:hypothetical protein
LRWRLTQFPDAEREEYMGFDLRLCGR